MTSAALPVLELAHASKRFGPVRVLKDVGLTLAPGEVHALLGENGAGKSTLIRIIGGIHSPDPGCTMAVDGCPLPPGDAQVARRAGIAIVHQELNLANNLTVAENIHLGREARWFGGLLTDRQAMTTRSGQVLGRLAADFGPSVRVGRLSLADRQLVEIARAVAFDARLIIMDEPTTSLSTAEVERLMALVRGLSAEGRAILYISHRMEEVFALADRATVLRDGSVAGILARSDFDADRIVRLMTGRTLSHRAPASPPAPGAPVVFRADSVAGDGEGPVSLSLRRGEVVGMGGLIGAGRTRFAERVCGLRRPESGRVAVNDVIRSFSSNRDAQAAGVGYLTEDRRGLGIVPALSVGANINLLSADRDAVAGIVLAHRRMARRTDAAMRDLSIRAASPRTPIRNLSGGNQQKALIARLLQTNPHVLILDEPTRGVDVGAKAQIYAMIGQLAQAGAAILVISSDVTELIGLCPRVIVMREGRVAGELIGNGVTEGAIVALASGVPLPSDNPIIRGAS